MEQVAFNALALGAVYGLAAQGFTFVGLGARVLHIAHASVICVAAYASLIFADLGMPVIVVGLAAVAVATVFGAAHELLLYAPLRRRAASGTALVIASLGAAWVSVHLLAMIFGAQNRLMAGDGAPHSFDLGWVQAAGPQLAAGLCALIVALGLVLCRRTDLGQDLVALADSPLLAECTGLPVARLRTTMVAMGSAFAGTAAAISAYDVGVDPGMGFDLLMVSIAGSLIGGRGVIWGGLAGGMLLGIIETVVVVYLSPSWGSTATFGALVLVLLARPGGLFEPSRRATEVL